jgi:hypothetical protein
VESTLEPEPMTYGGLPNKTLKLTTSGAQKWPKNAVQKRATKGHKKRATNPYKGKTAPKSTIVAASWPKRALSSACNDVHWVLERAKKRNFFSRFFREMPYFWRAVHDRWRAVTPDISLPALKI